MVFRNIRFDIYSLYEDLTTIPWFHNIFRQHATWKSKKVVFEKQQAFSVVIKVNN
jgi:hypothetical protein